MRGRRIYESRALQVAETASAPDPKRPTLIIFPGSYTTRWDTIREVLTAIFERMLDLRVAVDESELEFHFSEARSLRELPAVFTPGKSGC